MYKKNFGNELRVLVHSDLISKTPYESNNFPIISFLRGGGQKLKKIERGFKWCPKSAPEGDKTKSMRFFTGIFATKSQENHKDSSKYK